MIISQKFNSIHQIDPEFIPSLEELLSDKIPHFKVLEDYEKNAPEDISFAYYLFFGDRTNSPIGFAQLELKNGKPIKRPFLKKIFKKDPIENQFEKTVTWSIPGQSKEGILFNPRFINSFEEGIKQILVELKEREDIIEQKIFFSQAYSKIKDITQRPVLSHSTVPDVLIKNKSDYQEFYQSLDLKIQKDIKLAWKKVYRELGLEMQTFESFKHCFQYKAEGPKQYKELKSHPILNKYKNEESNIKYITLESKLATKVLLLFIEGTLGNTFYDVIYLDNEIPTLIVHQLACMKFYETESASKLHFLGDTSEDPHLINIGYTTKEITHINIPRTLQ